MADREHAPPDDPDYLERIERHFGLRRGGRLLLSPRDWQLVQEWRQAGIPVPVVMRGINRAFDRFEAAGPRSDRINSLSYCEQQVLEAWQEHRELAAADAGAAPEGDAGEDAARHLWAVAERCRELGPRHAGSAAESLEGAATELERLAVAAAAGEMGTREIDARAGEIEERLRRSAPQLFADAEGDAPELPRFSPWAV